MIKQQDKKKVAHAVLADNKAKPIQKEFANYTYNPELDEFTGDEFIPQKYKDDETRFAKSTFINSPPSFK